MNLSEGDTELKIHSNREGNMMAGGIGEGLTQVSYRFDY